MVRHYRTIKVGALSLNRTSVRDHRAVYIAPGCNIHSRNSIRVARETTLDTGEQTLTDAIGFINTSALWTSPARIPWIHQDHRDACALGFVRDEFTKLIERPVAVPASLRASNLCLAEPAQVLEGHSPTSVLRLLNKLLADHVIGVFLKTRLFSRELPKFAFGGLRAFLLKIGAAVLEDASMAIDFRTFEGFAFVVGRQIHDPQIHAHYTFDFHWLVSLHFTGRQKIETTLPHAQVALPSHATQEFHLLLATSERNLLTTFHGPDRDFHFVEMIRKDAAVVCYRSVRLESALGFAIKFVGIRDFRDATHRDLSAQLKYLPHRAIGQSMQRELMKGVVFPSLIAEIVAGIIGSFQSPFQQMRLMRRRKEFQLSSEFQSGWVRQNHRTNVPYNNLSDKKGAAFPLPAFMLVSRPFFR